MLGILAYVALSALMGCVSCFWGKRLYFPILMLTVFVTVLSGAFSLFEMTWKVGLIALTVGLAAALLSVVFYKVGVFVLGGALGAGIGQLLYTLIPGPAGWLHWALMLAPALILGLCALKWCWLFIMASTAYRGAVAVVVPLGFLLVHFRSLSSFIYADGMLSTMANLSGYLRGVFSAQYMAPLFAASLTLAVIGFLIQYRAERRDAQGMG